MSRPGRRLTHNCAFTSEITAQIIGAARQGMPRKYAAERYGIGERTLQRWVQTGRDRLDEIDQAWADGLPEDEIPAMDAYAEFVQSLLAAEAEYRGGKALVIAGDPDWRAKAWYLERVDHRQFGDLTKIAEVTHVGPDGDEASAAELLLEKIEEIADNEAAFAKLTGAENAEE